MQIQLSPQRGTPQGATLVYYNVPAEYAANPTYAQLIRWGLYPWAFQSQGQGASSGPIAPTVFPP